jgi:hypothetical protein
VVPAGPVLTVRTQQALSSKTSQAGHTFLATLAQPVSFGERRALPTGATVKGTVVSAKSKGKIKGEAQLSLILASISLGDHTRMRSKPPRSAVPKRERQKDCGYYWRCRNRRRIGGLAGQGKGAGIGALVGAGAGFIGGAVTGNKQIEIPAESALSFTLAEPLTLPPPHD